MLLSWTTRAVFPHTRRALCCAHARQFSSSSLSLAAPQAVPAEDKAAAARRKFGIKNSSSRQLQDEPCTPTPPQRTSTPTPPQSTSTSTVSTDQVEHLYKSAWGDYVEYMTHQREKGWKT
jgi:hypothetical protein